MQKEYTVFGDYGYTSETALYTTNSLNAAINWAKRYCENDCGYSVIDVAWFADDGEYITEWTKHIEEYA